MSKLFIISFLFVIFSSLAHHNKAMATCYGDKPCKACKNCKYCKHCAKDGGTCGVCK